MFLEVSFAVGGDVEVVLFDCVRCPRAVLEAKSSILAADEAAIIQAPLCSLHDVPGFSLGAAAVQ